MSILGQTDQPGSENGWTCYQGKRIQFQSDGW